MFPFYAILHFTDLCRRAVVGGVVEGGWDGRLMGQTWVLALDGVRVLVGVAAVVVTTSIPGRRRDSILINYTRKTKPMLF